MPTETSRKRSQGVDINILPPAMRRPRLEITAPALDRTDRAFWLMAILAALLLVYFYQILAQTQTEVVSQQVSMRILDAELQRRKTLPAELERLQATLTQTLQLSRALDEDYQVLVLGQIFWAEVLENVRGATPPGVEITDILNKGNQVVISGKSDTQNTVTLFAANLKKQPRFSNATVQSLAERPTAVPTPTPVPTSTPAPTSTPVPTATPVPSVTPTRTAVPVMGAQIVSVAMHPFRLTAGDVLQVDVTIRNTGNTVLRSQDPVSGYTYTEGDTVPVPGMNGRIRVGVDFLGRWQALDHPYRWGWSGELPPGGTVQVSGLIKLTVAGTREFWVGLVQEGVTWLDDTESRSFITVVTPTPGPTNTPTQTPAPTVTLTPTFTHSPTTVPTATPTASPTRTATPTATAAVAPGLSGAARLWGWPPGSRNAAAFTYSAIMAAASPSPGGKVSFTIICDLKRGAP